MTRRAVYSDQFLHRVRALSFYEQKSPALKYLRAATMEAIDRIKETRYPSETHRLEGARSQTPDLRDCHKWYVFPVEGCKPTHRIIYRILDDERVEFLNIGLREGLGAYREMRDITGRPVRDDVVGTWDDPSPASEPVGPCQPTKEDTLSFARQSHDAVKKALAEYLKRTRRKDPSRPLQLAPDAVTARSRPHADRQGPEHD